jgi:hypothetical protein
VAVSQNVVQQLDIQAAQDVIVRPIVITAGDEEDPLVTCDLNLNPNAIDHNKVNSVIAKSVNGNSEFTGIDIDERLSSNTGNEIGSASQATSINVSGQTVTVNGGLIKGISENVSVANDIIANLTATGTVNSSFTAFTSRASALRITGNQISKLTAANAKGILRAAGREQLANGFKQYCNGSQHQLWNRY